jgi:hypothetical protein
MLSGRPPSTQLGIDQLLDRLVSGSPRQKRATASALEKASEELTGKAVDALKAFSRDGDDWGAGWILQILQRHHPDALESIPEGSRGWFHAPSACDIDYTQLQRALLSEHFEEADRLTSCALRQLAGDRAVQRGYVYFSEVPPMEALDLTTIDRLWVAYSQGRFGFTVQARLLNALDGRYERLWPRIGWKTDGVWTRYPGSFQWSMDAPEGHMPLVNQLRGVRLMDALLQHPGLAIRT